MIRMFHCFVNTLIKVCSRGVGGGGSLKADKSLNNLVAARIRQFPAQLISMKNIHCNPSRLLL